MMILIRKLLLLIYLMIVSVDSSERVIRKKIRVGSSSQSLTLTQHSNVNNNDSSHATQSNPIFYPKQMEQPSDEDYANLEDDYEYVDYSSYDEPPISNDPLNSSAMATNEPNNRTRLTTPWPKSKNSTAPSKFNLNSIFEFIEIILMPTNKNENTIEQNTKISFDLNENNTDYYFTEETPLAATANNVTNTNTRSILSTRASVISAHMKNESLPWNLK